MLRGSREKQAGRFSLKRKGSKMAKIEAIEIKLCPFCGGNEIDDIMQKLPISTLFWRDSETEWGAVANLGEDGCKVAKGTSAMDAMRRLLEKLEK